MLELIAIFVIFYCGVWCGRKFGTLRAMYDAAKKKIDEALA